MKSLVSRLIHEEDGLETVEYAIIAGLIVVGTISTIIVVGKLVNDKFVALQGGLTPPAP